MTLQNFRGRDASGQLVSLLNPVRDDPPTPAEAGIPMFIRQRVPPSPAFTASSPMPRKYSCTECSSSFTSSGHLTRHFKSHTGEKSCMCPYPGCGKSSSRRDNLVQHYKTHMPRSPLPLDRRVVREALEEMERRVENARYGANGEASDAASNAFYEPYDCPTEPFIPSLGPHESHAYRPSS